nr:hypothetical protein [uncultured Chryseobacterium sp.]
MPTRSLFKEIVHFVVSIYNEENFRKKQYHISNLISDLAYSLIVHKPYLKLAMEPIEQELNNNEVTVTLALLNKDLQEVMNHCVLYQWKYEMIGSFNLQINIPKDSVHLLFYLGHKILSGINAPANSQT